MRHRAGASAVFLRVVSARRSIMMTDLGNFSDDCPADPGARQPPPSAAAPALDVCAGGEPRRRPPPAATQPPSASRGRTSWR